MRNWAFRGTFHSVMIAALASLTLASAAAEVGTASSGDASRSKLTLLWQRVLGTPADDDRANGVATDSAGNAFLVGYTTGALEGPGSGGRDAFVAKYDRAGSRIWLQQFGSSGYDEGRGVATDSNGNVLIAGMASGTGAFVAKYSSDGNPIWQRRVGTSELNEAYSVAADPRGNVLVAGVTLGAGAFVVKYGSGGNRIWERRLGPSPSDAAFGIATDSSGNVFVAGHTARSGVAFHALLAKFAPNGRLLWQREFKTPGNDSTTAFGVATDKAGDAILAGWISPPNPLPHGSLDAWIAKYDGNGKLVWSRQLGEENADEGARGIATNAVGNIIIAGFSDAPNFAGFDALLAKYSGDGALLWTTRFGTKPSYASGVAIDDKGHLLVSGTNNVEPIEQFHEGDAWIAKFAKTPRR